LNKSAAETNPKKTSLLLWLWRRTADVEVIGDKVVARRFRAFTLLD